MLAILIIVLLIGFFIILCNRQIIYEVLKAEHENCIDEREKMIDTMMYEDYKERMAKRKRYRNRKKYKKKKKH